MENQIKPKEYYRDILSKPIVNNRNTVRFDFIPRSHLHPDLYKDSSSDYNGKLKITNLKTKKVHNASYELFYQGDICTVRIDYDDFLTHYDKDFMGAVSHGRGLSMKFDDMVIFLVEEFPEIKTTDNNG